MKQRRNKKKANKQNDVNTFSERGKNLHVIMECSI
jgi:hypothetical protein